MTAKKFNDCIHEVLTATGDHHNLTLESAIKGGDRDYVQELMGRCIMRLKTLLVHQSTMAPKVAVAPRLSDLTPEGREALIQALKTSCVVDLTDQLQN